MLDIGMTEVFCHPREHGLSLMPACDPHAVSALILILVLGQRRVSVVIPAFAGMTSKSELISVCLRF